MFTEIGRQKLVLASLGMLATLAVNGSAVAELSDEQRNLDMWGLGLGLRV